MSTYEVITIDSSEEEEENVPVATQSNSGTKIEDMPVLHSLLFGTKQEKLDEIDFYDDIYKELSKLENEEPELFHQIKEFIEINPNEVEAMVSDSVKILFSKIEELTIAKAQLLKKKKLFNEKCHEFDERKLQMEEMEEKLLEKKRKCAGIKDEATQVTVGGCVVDSFGKITYFDGTPPKLIESSLHCSLQSILTDHEICFVVAKDTPFDVEQRRKALPPQGTFEKR